MIFPARHVFSACCVDSSFCLRLRTRTRITSISTCCRKTRQGLWRNLPPQKKSEFWVNPLEFKVKSPICIMSSKSADSGPPSPRIHHDLRLAMTCNDLQSTTRWDLSWSITILSSVQRQPLQWQRAKSPQPAAVYGRAEKKDLDLALSTARHGAESTTRTRDNPVLSSSARMFTHTHIIYIYVCVYLFMLILYYSLIKHIHTHIYIYYIIMYVCIYIYI